MSKPQVLFIGDLNKELPEYKAFSEKYECVDYTITGKQQLITDFKTKFSGISAIYGAWQGFMVAGGFKNEVIDAVPDSLKVISICSVGHDQYDHEKMTEKGIVLTHVPSDRCASLVADLVLYNTLASFRNFYVTTRMFVDEFSQHTVQARSASQFGRFDKETGRVVPGQIDQYAYGESVGGVGNHNPLGHTAVIVGFGQIGQVIGSRLAAIGMDIHYVKRTKLSPEAETQLPYKVTYQESLQASCPVADLVVIVAPGGAETRHMVNEDIINKFAKPIRIINVGRGSIIDEEALVKGLKLGKVAFAGLDVYEQEPRIHPGLIGRQDVLLTPHVGASTVENFDYTAIQAMKNIDDVLQGGKGFNRVN